MTIGDIAIKNDIMDRQRFKTALDDLIMSKFNLSADVNSDKKYILSGVTKLERIDAEVAVGLTEGAIVDYPDINYGVRFYLTKGTLRNAFNKLNDTDELEINLGHRNESPLDVLGTFRKSDLSVGSIGNNREALLLSLKLDTDNLFVKELKRRGDKISLSAEFYPNKYEFLSLTKDEIKNEIGIDLEGDGDVSIVAVSDISLVGFAIVKNPADVNAYNSLKLNKINMEDNTQNTITNQETATPEVITEEIKAEEVILPEEVKEEVEVKEEDVKNEEESPVIAEETTTDDLSEAVTQFKEQLKAKDTSLTTLSAQNIELKAEVVQLTTKVQFLEGKKAELEKIVSEILGNVELAKSGIKNTDKTQQNKPKERAELAL